MSEQSPHTQSISVRRSPRLHPSRAMLLGIGLWLMVGVFGLYDLTLSYAGRNTGIAYLTTLALLLPTLLSHAELRSWVGSIGGSYRLIQAAERHHLKFFAGWMYFLGWAALSGLVAYTFAENAAGLVNIIIPAGMAQPTWLVQALAVGLLLFLMLLNIFNYRVNWRINVWLVGTAIAGMVLLIGLLSMKGIVSAANMTGVWRGSSRTFEAIVILTAATWVIDLTYEFQARQRDLPAAALTLGAGPILAGVLVFVGAWAAPTARSLSALASDTYPAVEALLLGIGTLSAAVGWQVLSLSMIRQFHRIGQDGLLPEWTIRRYTRFKTPVMLILLQGLLTLAGILLGSRLGLARVAAFSFLVLQIDVNVVAIILGRQPRAKDRSIKLPVYPVIPASGAAICFLLLFALSWEVVVIGLSWIAIGAIIYWRVGRARMRSSQLGITVFQDTTRRPDVTSDYPVIVPIANPNTAHRLVAFGATIARKHQGHVSIVQVFEVPEHQPLDSGRLHAQRQLDLLEELITVGESMGVPVEGVTRSARSISQGILDTVAEESAQLIVMGWNPKPGSSRQGLGHILDEILDHATCDVAVVRGEWTDGPKRILVPASGGPHAPRAAELGLSLTDQSGGEVTVLNIAVVRESDDEQTLVEAGHKLVEEVVANLSDPSRAVGQVVAASNPIAGIVQAAEAYDAIMLGASEPSFMDDRVIGQLPLQIAQQTDKPFVLLRSYAGLTTYVARQAWQSVSDLLPNLQAEDRSELYNRVRRSARPNIDYFVLIVLSAMIATFGLLLNSPAVIIGAMLVAPLMGPIVSTGASIVFGDARTLRRASVSLIQGAVAAIFIAVLVTVISPVAEATPEVLARTRPNLLDLSVALVSGLAGAYVIARTEVGDALPGVAIAAALMPPVCAVGIGFALGDPGVAFGALLLFTANLVAIVFSSSIMFMLLGVRPFSSAPDSKRYVQRGLLISVFSLIAISLPLAFILFSVVSQDRIEQQVQQTVQETMADWGDVTLADFEVESGWQEITVRGTLHASVPVTQEQIQTLDDNLEAVLRPAVNVEMFVIEGTQLSGNAPVATPAGE